MSTHEDTLASKEIPSAINNGSGPANDLWRFFASLKLTVAVLLLLAATSIIGTVIPQQQSLQAYYQAYGEFLFRVFHALDIFNMYYSWWFRLLIFILAANIIVCTINRLPGKWKIVASKFNPSRFKRFSVFEEMDDPRPPLDLKPLYERLIFGKYRLRHMEALDTGFRLVAEKGRWSRFGVVVVHLSVLFLLIGALVGSIFGFEGYVNIPEGHAVDHIRLRNTGQTIPLPFTIRCNDFDVSFYESGSPKEYRSSLTLVENERPVVNKDIIVNDPLRYKGINMFQSSYGTMPGNRATLRFTHRDSGTSVDHVLGVGQSVDLPDEAGTFTLVSHENDYHFQGHELGNAFVGVLEKPGGKAIDIALPIRFATFDNMRKGEWAVTIAEYEKTYYTGLQVTSDPGVPLVYAGFILMILGCYLTFFVSHRKLFIEVKNKDNGSRITVSGSSDKNKPANRQYIKKLTRTLGGLG